jgi:broad-specificity NMP kinase
MPEVSLVFGDTRERSSTLDSVVPISRILVTGMSGTGKSSALAELGRRGYRVVDTDDPGWREYREYVEPSDEVHRGEWLWVEERITALLELSAPADVILDRIARRTTNSYGKSRVDER